MTTEGCGYCSDNYHEGFAEGEEHGYSGGYHDGHMDGLEEGRESGNKGAEALTIRDELVDILAPVRAAAVAAGDTKVLTLVDVLLTVTGR